MALSRQDFYDQIWRPKTSFVGYAPNWKNRNPVIAPSWDQFQKDQVQVSANGMYITGVITPSRADAMKRDFDNTYYDYLRDQDKKDTERRLEEITSREDTYNSVS